ncbi:hypothetical protein IFM89_022008 [Coptis chinensis]|uniref:Uncharacterized protein n=1 Tax=Coptis chinensis TaxID=261450 RepID=A0A835I5G6_9MAGN|nr:hypothetical protein IFM89_022008 [Coptis chinensis]
MSEVENVEESNAIDPKHDEDPVLMSIFDASFVSLVKRLETDIRQSIVEVFSHPKSKVAVVPAEMEQKDGESNEDYIKRLKSFAEKQCKELQDLLGRNATLAEDMAKTGGAGVSRSNQANGDKERVQVETLRRDLQEAKQRVELLKSEKTKIETEASMYCNLNAEGREETQKEGEAELNDLLAEQGGETKRKVGGVGGRCGFSS